MATPNTCETPFHLPDAMARAVICHAQRQADLTAQYLTVVGIVPSERPVRFPAAFLLELAAVLELGLWERHGLRQHLAVGLPTYREASAQLAARSKKGPGEFGGEHAASLSSQVLSTWIKHFAWDAPDLFGAEMVLDEADQDDDFIDLLAEFVWTHRQELQHLIRGEKQQ